WALSLSLFVLVRSRRKPARMQEPAPCDPTPGAITPIIKFFQKIHLNETARFIYTTAPLQRDQKIMTHISTPGIDTASGQETSTPQTRTPALVPARHRQFLVTLLGVYPIITLLLYFVLPLTAGWQIWQITLIVAPLMVAIMVFWLMPTIQKRLGRFVLVPAKR